MDIVTIDEISSSTHNTERVDFEFLPLFADERLMKVTIETNERVSDVSKIEELHGGNVSPR